MTPVDATRTCSTGHPSAFAVSTAIPRETASPSAPVQALAQPLLTTTAAAVLWEARRWSRVTTSGAATARFVVKIAAARAGGVDTSSARSRPDFLIPHATPAASKPSGAVMPPATRSTICCAS